ncbi:MAG: FxLYD domain-containing protein [Deltaproteobacteria bacterium]|jgi:hypothetical protein|nr:FxLYD domain-containing protein [Deltaproteobacteria bacterium]
MVFFPSWSKWPKLIACLILLLLTAACPALLTVPGDDQEPTDHDVFESGPGSLPIDVIDYSWSFTNSNTHIRIAGTVVNNSPVPMQQITLLCTLYDQNGNPIAYGETYVVPTYLPVGGKGTFEFVALTKKERGIKATRLITVARTLSSY